MEQRRLRLGDILDDYCPRERRVTNHAVVAMIEESVKQTRCTTCDAEHPYKGGKAPRKRKTEKPGALYREVLAGMPESEAAPILAAPPETTVVEEPDYVAAEEPTVEQDITAVTAPPDEEMEAGLPAPVEEGPVHRPLIRATLPRPEGQKDARPLPEFTIRQSNGRGGNGNFRGDARMKPRGGPGGNGQRSHGGARFAGPRSQHGRGGPSRGPGGFRSSQQSRHGGRKRSR